MDDAERDAGRSEEGEHRTTVKAESERLRAAQAAQADHPDAVAARGRAIGERPLETDDDDTGEPTA